MGVFRNYIRWKLLLLISILLMGISVVLTLQHVYAYKKFYETNFNLQTKLLKNNLSLRAKSHTDSLAIQLEDELAAYNFSKFAEIIQNDVSKNNSIAYIGVYDLSGKKIFEAPNTAPGTVKPINIPSQKQITVFEADYNSHKVLALKKILYIGMEPWGVLTLYYFQTELETKIAGYSKQMDAGIRQSVIDSLLSLTAFFFLFIPIAYFMSSRITRPIVELTQNAGEIAKGNFSPSVISDLNRTDELGILEQTFDVMRKNLEHSYRQLSDYNMQLEQMVQERTAELEQKNSELEKLSVTDKLTQLYNRVQLEKVFEEQFNRSKRYETPFSILLCDVDHFKMVNDTLGHIAGDAVLKELASVLKQEIRESDTIGRWGGEEFLIISPETDTEHALQLAERLRSAIENHPFSTNNRQTICIGISTYASEDTAITMLQKADAALYTAKQDGRNCVRFSSEIPSHPGEIS